MLATVRPLKSPFSHALQAFKINRSTFFSIVLCTRLAQDWKWRILPNTDGITDSVP